MPTKSAANSRAPTNGTSGRRSSSKKINAKMSTQVLLARDGLEDYYQYFEKAGKTMFDGHAHPTNMQVEQIILDVEKQNGICFVPEVRVRIWKALRHQWFRARPAGKFIERSQVPPMALPKRDYKQVDSMIQMREIDPDRQRQILRKSRPTNQPAFRGPAKMTLQFEVYKRQSDLVYEFKDLQRCVAEWQMKNPRVMQRQDTREEVLKLRGRNIMDVASTKLAARRSMTQRQYRLSVVVIFLKVLTGCLAMLMLLCAQYRYRSVPRMLFFQFFAGSNQFISGISFLMAYMFAYAVEKRWHDDPMTIKLQRMIYDCERLQQQISDFRVETEEIRMDPAEEPTLGILNRPKAPEKSKEKTTDYRPAPPSSSHSARKRGGKQKTGQDYTLSMWTNNAAVLNFNKELQEGEDGPVQLIQKSIQESFERLPPLPEGFRKSAQAGGDRMGNFVSRLGGVKDDDLVVRLPALPKLPPKPPPNAALPDTVPLGQLGDLRPPPQPTLPGPPPRGVATPPMLGEGGRCSPNGGTATPPARHARLMTPPDLPKPGDALFGARRTDEPSTAPEVGTTPLAGEGPDGAHPFATGLSGTVGFAPQPRGSARSCSSSAESDKSK